MKISYKQIVEKSISLCLAATLCMSISVMPSPIAYAAEAKTNDTHGVLDYEMRERVVEYTTEDGTYQVYKSIKYPFFFGKSASELKINERYATLISVFENQELVSDMDDRCPLQLGGTLLSYDSIEAEVTYNWNDMISIKETCVVDYGGAHPYHIVSGLIYENSNGDVLQYDDILMGSELEIDNILYSALKLVDPNANDYQLEALKLNTGYALTENGLCFYYNVGDAIERMEVIIPWSNNYRYGTGNGDTPRNHAYEDVLEMFYSNISSNWSECDGNGWDDVYDPDSVSYILSQYKSNYSLAKIGYTLIDLDDNGQSELLISTFDAASSGMFYELYSIIDGEVVHLVCSGERDRYYLAENNSINNEGSSGAASSSSVNYYLDTSTGKLKVKQAVIYDGFRDSENPWFYATTEYYDADTYETNYDVMTHISEEQAMSHIDSFPKNTSIELISFDSYSTVDSPDTIEIKAYTAFPDSTIGTQQEVKIQFSKYINNNLETIEDYTLDISDPSIIEPIGATRSNGSKIITIKGLKQGISDLTFIENSSGVSITLPLTVVDKCNYFRCSAFPVPYESSSSIYVADYSCSVNEDGTHNISFNAYNTSYAYGVVEIYNEEGTLIKLVPLDPRSDSSGMEKVVNGFKWVWEDVKDLFDGDTPFYTKGSNAKHTPVTLSSIPENAEIIITSDGDESNFATLYMGVDTFVRTVCTASSIDLKLDAQTATVKELMWALVDSLNKSISHDEAEKMIKEGLIKEATESISTAINFSSSMDSISDIYETVSNMFQSLDISAEDIIFNVLKGMGYSVADTAFTAAVPLYKIVKFVDQILETAWPLTDYQFNRGGGKMEIHVAKHGLHNFVSNNFVTITKQSIFSSNTVLDAYVIAEPDKLGNLKDVISEEIANYEIYNITLRENGVEIQPNEEIEVRLPVPDGADGKKCVVYRIEENGEKTLLISSYKDGYVTFRTSHLSYYLIVEATNFSASTVIIIISILVAGSIAVIVVLLKRKKCST